MLCLAKIAGGLAAAQAFGDSVSADWHMLANMLGFGSASRDDQAKALAQLLAVKEDMSGYHGVLKAPLAEDNFDVLRAWVEGGAGDQESTLLCKELNGVFQNLSIENASVVDRARSDAILQTAL